MYDFYKKEGGTLHPSLYKNICQDFNIRIMDHIIYEAGTFDMGNHLSTLSIRRLKRNYNNPHINWNESNKLKEELLNEGKQLYDAKTGEGEKWLVFHDEKWYCRFYWKKHFAKFRNKSAYRFVATRGKLGNKTKLKEHLMENTLNYIKYENPHQ